MHVHCEVRKCDLFLSKLLLELKAADRLNTLVQSDLTFINFFDVGMNKSVFAILPPLVGGRLNRILQINALNLAIYGTPEALGELDSPSGVLPFAAYCSPTGFETQTILVHFVSLTLVY